MNSRASTSRIAPNGRAVNDPFELVLSRLSDVQRNGDEATARCPAHDDKHASLSIGVGDDGRVLLHDFAGCSVEQIVAALGLTVADLFPAKSPNGKARGGGGVLHTDTHSNTRTRSGLTLAEYAEAKRLPLDFLQGLGLADMSYLGLPAVRISYRDASGAELAARIRKQLHKGEDGQDDRFAWRKGDKPRLYGLDRLALARAKGYLTIVEGESDCHTLWCQGVPAVGLPGATTWKERWAADLDGIPLLYAIVEPDQGGEAVKASVAKSKIRDRVRLVDLGAAKDPSGLYLADPPGFQAAWQAALERSVPWADLEAAEQEKQAGEAHDLASGLLADPDLLGRVGRAIGARGYAGDLRLPKLIYVAMTSRELERPINLHVLAPSGAGKNRACDGAAELMPAEAIYLMRAGSARALVYTEESFEHRTVYVGEADSIPEDGPAASAVRSLAADNAMAYDVVERDEQTGRHETRHIVKPGPTGLITTSTKPLGEQMSTRVLEVSVPDDPKQTRAVLGAHAASVRPCGRVEVDLEPFLAVQRWLSLRGERRVAVGFADALADLVPVGAVRMRRDFRQLLTTVQAVAFLYQTQRPRTPEGWVEATLDDYATARELLAPVFDQIAAEGVTPAVRQTVEAVKPGEEVSATVLAQRLGLSKSATTYRVARALEGGWLVNTEQRKGQPYKLALGAPMPEAASALPTVERVRSVYECTNASGYEGHPSPPFEGAEEYAGDVPPDEELG